MAQSHDNFFITTLIDRSDGKSSRVSSMVDAAVGNISRRGWVSTTSTAALGIFRLYSFTNTTTATLTLSDNLHALASPTLPYVFHVNDEGGNAAANNITIDTESGNINGGSQIGITTDFGAYTIYSNGTDYFVLSIG